MFNDVRVRSGMQVCSITPRLPVAGAPGAFAWIRKCATPMDLEVSLCFIGVKLRLDKLIGILFTAIGADKLAVTVHVRSVGERC